MWRRIYTLFKARNKEFFRDKSALGWNFIFPFLIIAGFSVMFSEDHRTFYKAGILKSDKRQSGSYSLQMDNFRKTKFIEILEFESKGLAINKLKHHRIDLLIDPESNQYWVNSTSPRGYMAEKLFHSKPENTETAFKKQSIKGWEVPYIEWLFPGILGMNIMFSSFFGVGYIVVRYRKNGVLKRMSVTPLRPFEFIASQIFSRIYVIIATTAIIYVGCALVFGFECRGSYLNLLFVFTLGGFCMITLGLVIASRNSSEEFANGLLNIISWPMMFLSEVWFSLEGSQPWVQKISSVLPLTHMIDSARKIMNDGAGLFEIRYQIIAMIITSAVLLVLGSVMFRWHKD